MIRTGDLLANSALRESRDVSFLLVLGVLVVGYLGQPVGIGFELLAFVAMLWALLSPRVLRGPLLLATTEDPRVTITARAWSTVSGETAVARIHMPDADVVIWSRQEPEALIAALRVPVAVAAFFTTWWLFQQLPLDAMVTSLPTPDTPVFDDAALVGVVLLGLVLHAGVPWGVHRVVGAPLRRRVQQDHHLTLQGQRAMVVQDERREPFSLDDVLGITAHPNSVQIQLLDDRMLSLRCRTPDQLAKVLTDLVGDRSPPELPEGVRHLEALRQSP